MRVVELKTNLYTGTARRRLGLVMAGMTALLLTPSMTGCSTTKPQSLTATPRVSQVVVRKAARNLSLYRGNQLVREYRINLGHVPKGHKMQEGDKRTPEGDYVLDWRNARSRYYKSIHISYPNARDRQFAQAIGIDPGGMIMIHGRPASAKTAGLMKEYDTLDWTDGCIAVSNDAMEQIWRLVPDGTPIRILP